MTIAQLKYPIGKFEKPSLITKAILKEWISDIFTFHKRLFCEVVNLTDDQLDTPYRPEEIYRGTSTFSNDIIATIEDGKVFSGNSSRLSDIQFSIDGNVTITEFVAIWHVVKYDY